MKGAPRNRYFTALLTSKWSSNYFTYLIKSIQQKPPSGSFRLLCTHPTASEPTLTPGKRPLEKVRRKTCDASDWKSVTTVKNLCEIGGFSPVSAFYVHFYGIFGRFLDVLRLFSYVRPFWGLFRRYFGRFLLYLPLYVHFHAIPGRFLDVFALFFLCTSTFNVFWTLNCINKGNHPKYQRLKGHINVLLPAWPALILQKPLSFKFSDIRGYFTP